MSFFIWWGKRWVRIYSHIRVEKRSSVVQLGRRCPLSGCTNAIFCTARTGIAFTLWQTCFFFCNFFSRSPKPLSHVPNHLRGFRVACVSVCALSHSNVISGRCFHRHSDSFLKLRPASHFFLKENHSGQIHTKEWPPKEA